MHAWIEVLGKGGLIDVSRKHECNVCLVLVRGSSRAWHCMLDNLVYHLAPPLTPLSLRFPLLSTPSIPNHIQHLSLRLKSLGEPPYIARNGALIPQKLDVGAIDLDLALGALLEVLFAAERGEAPVLGDDDLLAAGEFVLGAAEGFDCCCAVCRKDIKPVSLGFGL